VVERTKKFRLNDWGGKLQSLVTIISVGTVVWVSSAKYRDTERDIEDTKTVVYECRNSVENHINESDSLNIIMARMVEKVDGLSQQINMVKELIIENLKK
jgi:uncharacterized coiled-coil DUF342 family protein